MGPHPDAPASHQHTPGDLPGRSSATAAPEGEPRDHDNGNSFEMRIPVAVPGMFRGACTTAHGASCAAAGVASDAHSDLSDLSEIFHCEVDDLSSTPKTASGAAINWASLKNTQSAISMSLGMTGRTSYDRKLRADVEELIGGDSLIPRLDRLAAELCARGHLAKVRVSSAHYSPGTVHFSLKHTFIACMPPEGCDDQSLRIVDLAFREQFVIASPTAGYGCVLEAVPDVFVGTPATLKTIVDIMAAEISASFNSQMMPIPPWRRVHALYSKWFPSTPRCQGFLSQSDLALPDSRAAQAV